MAASEPAILVVDDEPLLLRLYERILVHAGHVIVTTDSAPDAIRILTRGEQPIWLVITDWQLAEGTSATLISHCHTHHPNLPILCVSGSITQHQVSVPLLIKPVPPDTLLAVIRSYAARRPR